MSETRPAISIQGVSKTFVVAGGQPVAALDNINLDIRPGEFVSLLGPSGCGKSTLLRLIGDLTTPSAGSIRVNGKPAAQARRDRDYGMVFQQATLYDWRSVSKNVQLPLEVMNYPHEKRETRTKEMLELVQLSDFSQHYPWQLSGGMQQRVAIARALAFQPSVLLMDEPFAAVDAQTRADLEDLVRSVWHQFGVTLLFVTHDIDEAVYLGQRVVVLSASPTTVIEDLAIDLPDDRDQLNTRADARFVELRGHVYSRIQQAKRNAPVA